MPAPLNWLTCLQQLAVTEPAVLITITATRGSVPRAAKTRMLVTANRQYDTIGGGHLEWKAVAHARLWLAETAPASAPRTLELALGPSLGQCCGGAVSLLLERTDCWSQAERQQCLQTAIQELGQLPLLYLFGAGHVGGALVNVLQNTPCRIIWVDERDHLFPAGLAASVQTEATDSPEAVIATAPAGAYFLVMTHHHGLDLRLSEHILRRNDVAWFGLIGSDTKRARFEHRLREHGIDAERLGSMVCPVGLTSITGKEPAVIAVSIAAQLLQMWSHAPALTNGTSCAVTETE
ncbi:xanthine dehydrogenase accessory protein XdhC [Undibacterium oligocarboniphilum]|uniref:Xanthine dehydrogenase accessory protein XdhC n=1 Tax=Undibacterium oligocarboniphilum TaxID=666702 RepID=A0A850QEZ8_9BURK|nr:xanthine dehydrogenase accessory protein XdhC [Undibacterium oligocarboniphilum]MBC3869509.1 xanthine dehydrogenase accessory protein XdhC [Undibacterium oligocarboniphilum]NVO77888.1 xanthine dehydrogenase accessory protein XdhC [Undibacterium oligocarboniphilum]